MLTAFFGEGFFLARELGKADGECHIGSAVLYGQHVRVPVDPVLSTLGIRQQHTPDLACSYAEQPLNTVIVLMKRALWIVFDLHIKKDEKARLFLRSSKKDIFPGKCARYISAGKHTHRDKTKQNKQKILSSRICGLLSCIPQHT